MYADTGTIEEEEYFPATIYFVRIYTKMSTPGPFPQIGLDLVTNLENIMS